MAAEESDPKLKHALPDLALSYRRIAKDRARQFGTSTPSDPVANDKHWVGDHSVSCHRSDALGSCPKQLLSGPPRRVGQMRRGALFPSR